MRSLGAFSAAVKLPGSIAWQTVNEYANAQAHARAHGLRLGAPVAPGTPRRLALGPCREDHQAGAAHPDASR